MSAAEQCETLDLLPNRLAVIPFGPEEVEALVGSENEYEVRLLAENFNWVAAYLCEEVGIFEDEVADWFRSEAAGLGHETPMSVWRSEDGFWQVFEYAQRYKAQVDEALAGEDLGDPRFARSHDLGKNALEVIHKSFEVAGVDLTECKKGPEYDGMRVIHNPHREGSPVVRWRGNQRMEEYRISIDEGPRQSMYYIIRGLPKDEEPMILQTGIGRFDRLKREEEDPSGNSDLDGRPPAAGEVANFVVPVANDTHSRSFELLDSY